MATGMRLGRVFGIKLIVDASLLVIFVLISFQLAVGVFPAWHPEWTLAMTWSVAIAAAILFFVSVLVHELSHALVGRAFGVPVRSITLFMFGGMANIERDPDSPKAELLMAIVGPIASLVIGVSSLLLGGWLTDLSSTDIDIDHGFDLAAGMGPAATLLMWLGPVNIVLALFNMVPAFPLDGGRVLRAVVWGATGDLRTATRWASGAGRIFAWFLIVSGVATIVGIDVPLFGPGLIQGMWLILIGWFLHGAAVASHRQLIIRDLLDDVPVARLMRRNAATIDPRITVAELVENHIMKTDEPAFPVVDGEHLIGIIALDDVRKIPRLQWDRLLVLDVMTPREHVVTTSPNDDVYSALQVLGRRDIAQLPVVENGRLLGILRRRDVARWLELQSETRAPEFGTPATRQV